MDDWEDTPILTPIKSKFYGEDEDDESDVKDSWDDEDEPIQVLTPPKKLAQQASKKKGKTVKGPFDSVVEELQHQWLIEETNTNKKDEDKTLDNFIPKSESEFQEYAELVFHKLQPFEKSFHYIGLLKAVAKMSIKSLKSSEMKDIASSISILANEKLKLEKSNDRKSKTVSKKKHLKINKLVNDYVTNKNDDVADDFDFM